MRTIFLFGTLIFFQVHASNAAEHFQTTTHEHPAAATTQHVFRHDPVSSRCKVIFEGVTK